ncbi:MAG: tol-pal system YbgF family protein [Kiritimatiellia bacterium]
MDHRTIQVARVLLAGLLAFGLSACGNKAEKTGDAAALIGEGWTAYRLSEFQNAVLAFEAARAAAEKGSDDWAMATYGLATVWDLRRPGEDPKQATLLYKEILAAAPVSPMLPWTELALARQQHLVPVGQEPDYAAVNAAYRHIMEKFPGHLAAKEAFLYLQSIQLAQLDPKTTRAAERKLREFVQSNQKEFAAPAWSLLAVAYTTLGEQEQRLEAERNAFELTEVDPSDPFIEFAWAYWNLATIAEFEVGDFDLARTYYNLLLEKYPKDIRVYGCKQALARMGALEAKIRAEEGI